MQFLINVIKGAVIGIANVIPGVSGGTMAVSLGIYERLIHTLTNLKKELKKNIGFLAATVIGAAVGIVVFARAIEYLLLHYPLATAFAFTGLVLGGIPVILKSLRQSLIKEKSATGISAAHIFIAAVSCMIVLVMALFSGGEGSVSDKTGIADMIMLFAAGAAASAAMVIPGVSGSAIMMILGYYDKIISSINRFIEAVAGGFDIAGIADCLKVLIPFGIGVIVGIVAVAKLIDFLFKRFASYTFMAILGLITASPGAIVLNIKNEYGFDVSLWQIIVGILLAAACFGVVCRFGNSERQ